MTDLRSPKHPLASVITHYAVRDLALVDVIRDGSNVQRMRLDVAGQRLHLVYDEGAPTTLALEARDALHLDDRRQPGIVRTALVLANELHGRLHHVRYVFTPVATGPSTQARALGLASAFDVLRAREVLVSVHFSAPLYDTTPAHALEAFDLGLDALLYAGARLHQDLEALGFTISHLHWTT